MVEPKFLKENDKVHKLFKAFHAHNLPDKEKLCKKLRELIDSDKISGSASIRDLMDIFDANKIKCSMVENGIYKVITIYSDNEDDIDYDDPDYNDEEDMDEENQSMNMVDLDKQEISYLCSGLSKELKKMEDSCVNKNYQEAIYSLNRMALFFEKYMDIMRFIVESYELKNK